MYRILYFNINIAVNSTEGHVVNNESERGNVLVFAAVDLHHNQVVVTVIK